MELLPDHRNEVTWLAECERIPNVSRVWCSTTTYICCTSPKASNTERASESF